MAQLQVTTVSVQAIRELPVIGGFSVFLSESGLLVTVFQGFYTAFEITVAFCGEGSPVKI